MKFVDLFAGLGGFNLALSKLGHECVFACEIDESLQKLYKRNFGLDIRGDIRLIDPSEIPPHDILCAGFPCQPFSKAGNQKGFEYPEIGGLYLDLLRIINFHHPHYLILENVPNFQRHGNGESWKKLEILLHEQGYEIEIKRLSPHEFGIPQIRDRIYIVGNLINLKGFVWPKPENNKIKTDLRSVLDNNPSDARYLPTHMKHIIKIWQEFVNQIPKTEEIPLPIWSMEFGATYPYKECTPSQMKLTELRKFHGCYGYSLKKAKEKEDALNLLPSYAQGKEKQFPKWKIKYIEQNREFYKRHKKWIDYWIPKIIDYPPSFQKFEWNCHGEKNRKLSNYILQVRPSGVRVKRPTTAPSLVAMTATQVPIITWEKRYMTPTECKRLQSMGSLRYLPLTNNKAYEALGNAVNVEVVRRVARSLLKSD